MRNTAGKENQILEYITKRIEETGYSPSVRDIRDALGIKSTSTVHSYLERLEKKGAIVKDSGKSRSLRLEKKQLTGEEAVKVPVLGKVAAGIPITAVENRDGFVDFVPDRRMYDPSELFALKIQGESMIEAGIMDGDTVIVRATPVADNGKIVVALVDDEATCKRLFVEEGHIRLQPENSSMAPIIVESAAILGEVVACIRYY